MIDYQRLKRIEPDPGKIPLTLVNILCVIFIALGVMVMFKRYKDKESRVNFVNYSVL